MTQNFLALNFAGTPVEMIKNKGTNRVRSSASYKLRVNANEIHLSRQLWLKTTQKPRPPVQKPLFAHTNQMQIMQLN